MVAREQRKVPQTVVQDAHQDAQLLLRQDRRGQDGGVRRAVLELHKQERVHARQDDQDLPGQVEVERRLGQVGSEHLKQI